MAKTINNHQLTPDATYLVRGKVGFCRISRHTTDKEREQANQRRTHPVDRNYTTITLYEAVVIPRDPANPTVEERYAVECLYKSSSADYPGNNFSAMNKSKNLPRVGVIDPGKGPGQYSEIVPDGELAKGLDVTLVMRVFKGQGNNGVSLDRVLVNEPIRYYGNSDAAVDKSLADYGITFQAMAPGERPAPAAEPEPAEEEPAAPSAPEAPSMNNAFSASPAAPQGQQTANASTTPPTAPDAPAENSAFGTNPFGNFAGNAGANFGPGARQY